MYKDKRVEKKKTVVMKRCLNPVFNESFAFDIPTERLRETTIVITVMDKDRLSRNDVIGKVGDTPQGPQVGTGDSQARGCQRLVPSLVWVPQRAGIFPEKQGWTMGSHAGMDPTPWEYSRGWERRNYP